MEVSKGRPIEKNEVNMDVIPTNTPQMWGKIRGLRMFGLGEFKWDRSLGFIALSGSGAH